MPITCIQVAQYRCPERLEPFNKTAAIVLYINTEPERITPAVSGLENYTQLSDLESVWDNKRRDRLKQGWGSWQSPPGTQKRCFSGAGGWSLASVAAVGLVVPSIYLKKYFKLLQLPLFVIKGWTKGLLIRGLLLSVSVCLSRRRVCGCSSTAKPLRYIRLALRAALAGSRKKVR